MKKYFFVIAFCFISFISFSQEPVKKNSAEVNQYSGIYVFIDCKPVREFEYIATMKKTCLANSMVEACTKYAAMAKKEHPDCDGIIFRDVVNGFSKDVFDVIKFK